MSLYPFDGIDVITSPHVPRDQIYVAGRRSYMHPGTLERMIEREGYMREAREIARRVVKEWEDRLFPPQRQWINPRFDTDEQARRIAGARWSLSPDMPADMVRQILGLSLSDWQVVAMQRVLDGGPWHLPRGRKGF